MKKVVRVYFSDLSCKAYTVPEQINIESWLANVASSIELLESSAFRIFYVHEDGDVKLLDPDDKPVEVMDRWRPGGVGEEIFNYFLFKKDPFAIESKELLDPVAVMLLYKQALRDVIESKHSDWVDEGTSIALAGIQMQVTYGDHNPHIHLSGFFKEKLQKYVPSDLFDSKEESEWETAILEEHAKHAGGSPADMMLKYLSYFDAFKTEDQDVTANEAED